MKRWFFALCLLMHSTCYAVYYSQCGQDKFAHEQYFRNVNSGVFVDIGAHDGKTYSNTYFFEQKGWTGICVEPLPQRFAELTKQRHCICVQGCVADYSGKDQLLMVTSPKVNVEMLSGLLKKYDPRHLKRVDAEIAIYGGSYELIDVDCYLLNDLLKKYKIKHVHFLSIDTEGGEFEILSSIDWKRYRIDVITVEDNYDDPRFIPYLQEKGYVFVKKLSQDLLFVRKDFLTPRRRR